MNVTVLLLALCQALMMTGTSLVITTIGLVGLELAHHGSLATLPLGIQFLCVMATAFPASLFMKHFGRRAGFALGALIGLSGAVLCSLAIRESSFWLFCAGAGFVGIFNSFGQFYRFAAADVATDEFRGRAISMVLTGGVIAAFTGPNLANWTSDMMEVRFAGSYAALTGVYLLSLILVSRLRIPLGDTKERTESGRPLWQIVRQPKFLVAVLSAMIGYGVMSLVMTATPLAMLVHQHSFGETAFVIQWHVLAMFAPAFATGHLIRRFGVLRIMTTGALLLLGSVMVNVSGVTLAYFSVALVLLGIGWNFLFIGGTTLLTECYSSAEKAKTQALNDMLIFATTTCSALTAGVLLHLTNWTWVNLLVMPFLGLVLIFTMRLSTSQAASSS